MCVYVSYGTVPGTWNVGPRISRLVSLRVMTSTTVVEIIDLTDTPPAINDEAETAPQIEDHGTDANPENNTAGRPQAQERRDPQGAQQPSGIAS